MAAHATQSASQTLITGVYRTGSEFVALLAGCHPALSVTMYSVNVLRFTCGRFEPISERRQYLAALDELEQRLAARYNRTFPRAEILAVLERAGRVDYGLFYDTVMSALYLRPPAAHWAEKNQLLWREIPLFLNMMPNGKAILVLRDPRSVLVSFRKYTYAPPPAYLGAVFNCYDAMQKALRFQRELSPERFLTVRYEDAAAAPQAAAERIWRFLSLEGTHDVNDRRNWRDAYGRPWHANSSFHANEDASAFDISRSIRRWEEEISAPERALAEGVCGDLMREFGYDAGAGPGDWLPVLRLFIEDEQVTGYFRHWLKTGEGIEAFPTDPLNPENWGSD